MKKEKQRKEIRGSIDSGFWVRNEVVVMTINSAI